MERNAETITGIAAVLTAGGALTMALFPLLLPILILTAVFAAPLLLPLIPLALLAGVALATRAIARRLR